MTDAKVTVFIDERAVSAAPGTPVGALLREVDPELAHAVTAGGGYLTDGVGRRVSAGTPVCAGAIFRLVRTGRRRGGVA